MLYEMIVEYIKTAKYRIINNIKIYDEEKIILVDAGNYYLLIQAHDNKVWIKLLSIIRTKPSLIKYIIENIHNAVDTLVPGTISIMYLRRKDILE